MGTCSQSYGGHGERETPGHIPNPEAKPLSADGTAPATGWESRTPPDNTPERGPSQSGCGPRSSLMERMPRVLPLDGAPGAFCVGDDPAEAGGWSRSEADRGQLVGGSSACASPARIR